MLTGQSLWLETSNSIYCKFYYLILRQEGLNEMYFFMCINQAIDNYLNMSDSHWGYFEIFKTIDLRNDFQSSNILRIYHCPNIGVICIMISPSRIHIENHFLAIWLRNDLKNCFQSSNNHYTCCLNIVVIIYLWLDNFSEVIL